MMRTFQEKVIKSSQHSVTNHPLLVKIRDFSPKGISFDMEKIYLRIYLLIDSN